MFYNVLESYLYITFLGYSEKSALKVRRPSEIVTGRRI